MKIPEMKAQVLLALHSLLSVFWSATALNFAWEAVQLDPNETSGYPDAAFGDLASTNASPYSGPKCKVGPGDPEWPTVEDWTEFNKTLGGVLLQPSPPAAVCYPNHPRHDPAQCAFLLSGVRRTRFYSDDPVTILTDWPSGNTCPAARNPVGNCTQGGYAFFVVNATTVRHIQLAVNFARNRHLRLVIKNTGHEFVGRATGAGALSIWTHYLKDFEYIPDYTFDQYRGRVARVSAGVETWELYNYMDRFNMTMTVPGGDTVGVLGGWIAGGGHNFLSSAYGHGADQILAFQVVTADGRYRRVTPTQNPDLFFAMLGGGGSTYGVLTSAIVKAYPRTPVVTLNLAFEVRPRMLPFENFSFPPGNGTGLFPPNITFPGSNESLPGLPPGINITIPDSANLNSSFPLGATRQPVVLNDTELFWEGARVYQHFAPIVCDAGGTLYSYFRKTASTNNSYTFTTRFELPNRTPQQAHDLVQPLYTTLNGLGIPVINTLAAIPPFPSPPKTGTGASPGNNYFSSRLFPRTNWDNETIYNATFVAIRATVEAGYTFHGVNHWVPHSVAGYPGNMTSINRIWRASLMHADIFDHKFRAPSPGTPAGVRSAMFQESHQGLQRVMDLLREVTPAGGAYYNEADVLEKNWQRTFFGEYYGRLVEIKRARDPWGLFWAPTMPGSEGWVVRHEASENGDGPGLPTQNARLCRVGGRGNG